MIFIVDGVNVDGSPRIVRSYNYRVDTYPTVELMSEQVRNDPERKIRVLTHQKRVQKELVNA